MSARRQLTPYMFEYERQFTDGGEIRWLPYLMYFHPTGYRSSVVNTDEYGFRYSVRQGKKVSVGDNGGARTVKLISGSSTVFGIGASDDGWTLASCLTRNDRRGIPWLNFGGRSFNSTQELMLLVLYRHLLPKVDEIVLFSGFNNLGLARLPAEQRQDHGAFFNCTQFYNALPSKKSANAGWTKGFKKSKETDEPPPLMGDQLKFAVDLTLRHLDIWNALAKQMEAKLTFVLQPLSGWVRPRGSNEEEALFSELDQIGRFSDVYGDILRKEICHEYASQLKSGALAMGVNFLNISPVLSEVVRSDQWLFVDRIHFTDEGHDFVSKQLLELL